jgi:hypothetical protein
MMTNKLFIPFTVSTIMAGLWAGCPSGDYDLEHIIVGPSGRGGIAQTGGTAGTLGSGGSPGTGGNVAAGGNAGKVVTFNNGQAQGAMTGPGWVALGTETTLTDPTCSADKHPIITDSALCTTTINWNSTSALCISGSIAALPAAPTQDDYANNWGVQVGVSATAPSGGVLGQSFSNVTFTFAGTPTAGVRAEVHRKGDSDATPYCAYISSGTAVPLTSFSTECWTPGMGTFLTAADVPNIDKIALQISSSSTAIAVQDFCMSSIEFGN